MSPCVAQEPALVDWSVAGRPLPGQVVTGDLHLVKPFTHGLLLAAIDGVGHGEDARTAACLAKAVLEEHAHEPVLSLIQRCHTTLAQTRGAVMTVVSLDARKNTLTWLGVGNVEGVLLRAHPAARPSSERVLLRSGIVGYHWPASYASEVPIAPKDLLILATDGIGSGFSAELNVNESPTKLAARILHLHFKGTDDGLVLVARYRGTSHE